MTTSDDTSAETLAATQTDTPVTQAVFIDSRVPDIQDLIAGAQPGEKVFVLDSDQDGLDQIASDLASAGLSNLSAISIVGHGASGQMLLGSTLVDEADLASHAGALAEIGAVLKPGGDLSLYGCDVAEGAAGAAFIADLSAYAGGVDVAAATHLVGSADQGGSFVLDASTGVPIASSAFTAAAMAQYEGVLGTAAASTMAGDPFVLAAFAPGNGSNYALTSVDDTGAYPQTATTYDEPQASMGSSAIPTTPTGQAPTQIAIDPQNNTYVLAVSGGDTSGDSDEEIFAGRLSDLNTASDTAPTLIYKATQVSGGSSSFIGSLTVDPVTATVLFTEDNTFKSVPYAGGTVTTVKTLTTQNGAVNSDSIVASGIDTKSHDAYFFAQDASATVPVDKTTGMTVNTFTQNIPSSKVSYPTRAHNYLYEDKAYTSGGGTISHLAFNMITNGSITSAAVDSTESYVYFTVESTVANVAGVYKYDLSTQTYSEVVTLTSLGLKGSISGIEIEGNKYYFTYLYNNNTSSGETAAQSGVYVGNLNGSPVSPGHTIAEIESTPTANLAVHQQIAVDEAPTLTGSQQFTPTYTVGGTPVAPITNAGDSDPDGDGDLASATVVISGNYQAGDKLNFTNTGSISGSYNAGTLTLTGPGTYAQYDAALDSVTFSSTSETSATPRSFTYSVSDGLVSSTTIGASVMVTVPPPAVGGGGTTVHYTETGTAVTVDPVVAVQDQAGADITGATVTISSGYFAGDTLAITLPNGSPISILSNTGGILTLTGSASAAAYQTALQSVTFSNSGQNPDDYGTKTTRSITFQVKDSGASSGTVSSTVDISAVDDPPVITVGGNTGAFTEKASAVFISPNASVSDVDNLNFNGGSLTAALTANGTSADQLTIENQGTAAGQIGVSGSNVTYGGLTIGTVSGGTDGTSLVVSFNSSATPTATTALVEDIQFSNTSNVPSTAPRTVTYTINDGSTANNGNPVGTATATVTVTAVDDPPSFSGLATGMPTVYAGAAAVGLEGSGTIADPELDAADDYAGATLTFARDGGANANDVFGASGSLSLASGVVEIGSTTVGSDTNAGGTLAITFNANATTALVSEVFQDITYANTGTTAGTPQIDFTINDGNTGAQGTGGAKSATGNIVVDVVTDAPPVISGTSATPQTVADDATITPFTGVSITDTDTASQTVTVTLSHPTFGSLSNLGGGTYTAATGTYTVTDTNTNVTSDLDGLVFTPTDNQIAPGTTESEGFTIASNDGSITTTDTKTNVTITSINDPPTITGTSATVQNVDDNATINPFNGVTIGDVDNPAQTQTVTVTLSAPADGTLSTALGGFSATATLGVYTFSGTAMAATTALDALVFTPTDNQIAPGTSESEGFTIASNDGAGGTASDSKTNVTITSIDDAPTIGGTVANQTMTDKGTAMPFSGVTIGDPDFGASESVTIDVTAGGVASDADGTLSGAGLTETSPGSGTYTLTAASPSTVQAALRVLVFTPTANQVPSGSVTTGFTLSVSDGIATPATTDSQTSVVATSVNDPPTASATATNPTFQQGGSAVALFSAASVSTIESGQTIKDLTLTVSGLADGANEHLTIDGTSVALTAGSGATTTNGYQVGVALHGGTATVSIDSAGATPAAVQTLIDGLAYSDTATAPTKGARDVTLTSLMDNGGTANGGVDTSVFSLASTVTVAVPPVVTAGGSTSYTERGMADDVAPGLTISDQNSATIASATASITAGFRSGDTLAATVPGGIAAAYDPTTGILTLTGVATVAAYQTALDSVTFASTSHDPTASGTDTSRTIAVQIDDGFSTNHQSNSATTNVTVTGVDDAPVLANPTATASYVEAGAPVVLNPNLSVTDAELTPANSFAGATLTLARDGGADADDLFGGSGALTLSGGIATVSNVTIGNYTDIGGSFVLTFGAAATGADVDTALQSLTYATSGHALPASLQIDASFSDGNTGAQGTGGAKTAVGDTTISVGVAAPSAPMLAAASDTGVSNHDGVTALDTGLVFTGTAEADTHLTLYDGQTAIGSTMVGTDGTWTVTEPGALSDGTHQISAATTNGSNVTSASSGTTTIVVHAHPAATTVTGISAATDSGAVGDGLTDVATPVIVGTAEAGATVQVYDGATLLGATAATSDGSWMLQPTHALSDGPHTIDATASDLAGNVVASTMGFSLTIDTVAPTIAINAPIAGDETINASEAAAGVTISGTTTGAETNQPVNVGIVDASGNVDDAYAGSVSATGAWSVAVTAAQAQALADGSYTVEADVSDKAGNPASEARQALGVDETRPGITAVAASGPGIAADGSGDLGVGKAVTFTATTSEPVVVAPAADGSTPTVTFDDGGIATYTGPINTATTSLIFSSTVAPGQNTVALQLEGITGAADVTDTAGNPIDLSSLASAAFPTGALTIDTTAPTVPASPTLTVAQDAGPTAIGIAAPSDNLTATNNLALAVSTLPTDGIVTLAGGTTPVTVGEALPATQLAGLAFTPTPGASSQSSTFTYSVTDGAGNATQGSATLVIGPAATPPTPTPTPDTISLDPNPAFLGAGTFLLTGAASSPAGVAAVEISARVGGVNGVETDLGAATLNPDGTFSFADHVGATVQGFITATETDKAGGTVSDTPSLSLEAGLGGSPYAAREDHYAPDGSRTTSTLFRPDGSSTTHADGPGQTLTSNAFDIFENGHRADTTFVFDPGFGIDVVKGFQVGGPGHDVIDLPSSDFTGIADVLRHTGDIQGSAWITDPKTGDAIRFAGVSKAELASHPKDFAFHA